MMRSKRGSATTGRVNSGKCSFENSTTEASISTWVRRLTGLCLSTSSAVHHSPRSSVVLALASVFRLGVVWPGLLPAQDLVDLDAAGLEGIAQDRDASVRTGLAAHEHVEGGVAGLRPGMDRDVALGQNRHAGDP